MTGEVRSVRDAQDAALELDVIATSDENDPGHAEIRGRALHERPKVAAKALKKLFRLTVPPISTPQE